MKNINISEPKTRYKNKIKTRLNVNACGQLDERLKKEQLNFFKNNNLFITIVE